MDKLTPDLQSWLDNSEEEVFFYLRNNWPLFKRRDELRLELDDMMQFCVGSEKHELFEGFPLYDRKCSFHCCSPLLGSGNDDSDAQLSPAAC